MGWYEKQVFDRALDRSLDKEELHAERRATLVPARGRVLEVGMGTGLNLLDYPDGIQRVTDVTRDPEPSSRAAERARRRGIELVHVQGDAQALPFADASFDTVVCTLLLCTVRDPGRAAREMARVLAPGGELLVFEHVAAPGRIERLSQHLVRPALRLVACGCSPVRDTAATLERSGFRWLEVHRYASEGLTWPTRHVVRGRAARAPA